MKSVYSASLFTRDKLGVCMSFDLSLEVVLVSKVNTTHAREVLFLFRGNSHMTLVKKLQFALL